MVINIRVGSDEEASLLGHTHLILDALKQGYAVEKTVDGYVQSDNNRDDLDIISMQSKLVLPPHRDAREHYAAVAEVMNYALLPEDKKYYPLNEDDIFFRVLDLESGGKLYLIYYDVSEEDNLDLSKIENFLERVPPIVNGEWLAISDEGRESFVVQASVQASGGEIALRTDTMQDALDAMAWIHASSIFNRSHKDSYSEIVKVRGQTYYAEYSGNDFPVRIEKADNGYNVITTRQFLTTALDTSKIETLFSDGDFNVRGA